MSQKTTFSLAAVAMLFLDIDRALVGRRARLKATGRLDLLVRCFTSIVAQAYWPSLTIMHKWSCARYYVSISCTHTLTCQLSIVSLFQKGLLRLGEVYKTVHDIVHAISRLRSDDAQ